MSAASTAIRTLLVLLARGEFETIENMDRGERIDPGDLARVVSEYGRTIVEPPDDWWSFVDLTPIADAPRFHAVAPLWTVEEGRSDLSLELHLVEVAPGAYLIELLDLHVL